jgi:hypothetical protein
MIIDVNSPQQSIDRSAPWTSYTVDYVTRIFGVVEAFKGYPNTMAFFAANEVMNDVPTGGADPPYIRVSLQHMRLDASLRGTNYLNQAVQRDLRQYIAAHSSRTIPVGYSAADVRPILQDTWNYLQCNNANLTTDDSRSEFFGLNSYSWCGASATYQSSGYDTLVSLFSNSSIPVFFSEYGCNEPVGVARVFNEVGSLYGTQMTALSGGLVYEYSQETSDFGLVVINGNGSVSLRTDFDNLQGQYNKLNVTLLEASTAASTSYSPPACSASLITTDGFSTNFTLPAAPAGAAALISNGISNPNQGKLVSVGSLNVVQQVFSSGGKEIKGLAVKPITNANTPSGDNTSGGATGTTTTSASATATKKSAAPGGAQVGTPLCVLALSWLILGLWRS